MGYAGSVEGPHPDEKSAQQNADHTIMTYQKKCPVCHSSKPEQLLFCEEFQYFAVPVSKSDKEEILQKYKKSELTAPLDVRVCNNCCHCFLGKLPDRKIIDVLYEKYYSYPSPLNANFKPERDDAFLGIFEKLVQPLCRQRELTRILEVGCYDGYILYHLQEKGFEVTGCDPSEGANIGKDFGVNIIKDFFDEKKFVGKNQQFDIVISRHFTEHLSEPGKWIKGLSQILKKDGIIVIEVPNVEFYLERGLLEVFSLQHLQAFSIASLHNLIAREGLNIFKIKKTMNNLLAIAEKGAKKELRRVNYWEKKVADFNEKLSLNKSKIQNAVQKFVSKRKTIAIWGAGGFGLVALSIYGVSAQHVSFIIDSDPKKQGMEYIGYSIQIVSPEEALQKLPNLIIIASMYTDGIIKAITDYGFVATVMTLFPDIGLLNNFGICKKKGTTSNIFQ